LRFTPTNLSVSEQTHKLYGEYMRRSIILLPLVFCSVLFISCASDKLDEKKATAVLKDYVENEYGLKHNRNIRFQNADAFLVQGGSEVMTTIHYSVQLQTTGEIVPQSAHAIFTRAQNGTWYLTMLFGSTLNIEVK
jgi:hypothetical protein